MPFLHSLFSPSYAKKAYKFEGLVYHQGASIR
jgi:hypothetical protein